MKTYAVVITLTVLADDELAADDLAGEACALVCDTFENVCDMDVTGGIYDVDDETRES